MEPHGTEVTHTLADPGNPATTTCCNGWASRKAPTSTRLAASLPTTPTGDLTRSSLPRPARTDREADRRWHDNDELLR
jgi:hypothetical protein